MNIQIYDMRKPDFRSSLAEIQRCTALCFQINQSEPFSQHQRQLMDQLFTGRLPASSGLYPPVQIDMGSNITIGENVIINHSLSCMARGGIVIENDVMISPQATILTANHDLQDHWILLCKPVHIRKNAWIGARAVLLPGVTVEENAIVAAGSVVTKDVAPYAVVGGNPAKVIRTLNEKAD